jgi:alpha-1,2-mannosyltransferase
MAGLAPMATCRRPATLADVEPLTEDRTLRPKAYPVGRRLSASAFGSLSFALTPRRLWLVATVSAATMALYLGWLCHQPQMDFQVYRMGGGHVLHGGLYSARIVVQGRPLLFTYPPVAGLLFWPFSHLSTFAGQVIWDAVNLAALSALIAVSIAAARGRGPGRVDWRTSLILLAPIGLLLYPVRIDLALGQVNLVLALMIVVDLTTGASYRARSLPRGVLVGFAAALKLTPLVFIGFLVVSRQWRAARNATLTFVAATGVMFAVAGRASWLYFTKDAFDLDRIGDSLLLGNQSLRAATARGHVSTSSLAFDLVCLALLAAGVTLASVAYRRSSALLAVLLCAATGLLVSPISWTHHYVWIVPVLIWLVVGIDRPAKGEWWALAAALPFVVLLPFTSSGTGPLWYLRANAYVVSTLLFLGAMAAMLVWRGGSDDGLAGHRWRAARVVPGLRSDALAVGPPADAARSGREYRTQEPQVTMTPARQRPG